jgi:hypothetical protein
MPKRSDKLESATINSSFLRTYMIRVMKRDLTLDALPFRRHFRPDHSLQYEIVPDERLPQVSVSSPCLEDGGQQFFGDRLYKIKL